MPARFRSCSRHIPLALLLTATASLPPLTAAQAQQPESSPPRHASAFLPSSHWALAALRRLDALDLLPASYDAGVRHPPRARVTEWLATAERLAAQRGPPAVAALARAYVARFDEEFPQHEPAASDVRVTSAWLDAGYRGRTGEALTGIGYYDNDWTGTVAAADQRSAVGGGELSLRLGTPIAAAIEPVADRMGVRLQGAYAVLDAGPLGFWGGRRSVGFSPGIGGGVVLGDVALDGGGLFLPRPIRLPAFLRALGPIGLDLLLSRVQNGDRITHPWLWAARLSASPHPRLTLGFNRANLFAGDGGAPVTLRNVAQMLIGKHAGGVGEFNDETASVDARWRPPLGPLPLALYVEWGFDDNAGAWLDVPGVVAGANLPALPGLPGMGLGAEYTRFPHSCCGNSIWYRNYSFRGGWTDERRPLGHPLGGNGDEWLVHVDADLLQARLRLRAEGYFRDRGGENLYAPERVGHSAGGSLRLGLRVSPAFDLIGDVDAEDGSGWSRSEVSVLGRWLIAR